MKKQDQVLKYLSKNGASKKSDIYSAMEFGYYHNWEKHFGELLKRMVNSGKIKHVSTGIYDIAHKTEQLSIL